jgi:DNA modification methylase
LSRIETIAEGVTLYLGDCREILPELGCFATAVVTDPPYRLTSGGKTPGGMQGGWMTDYSNDGSPVICDVSWLEIMKLIYDASAKNSDAYVMANDKNVHEALNAANEAGFRFHNLLVWDKVTAVANRWYMKNCEFVLYLYKGAAVRINDAGSKQLYRVPQVDDSTHPTEKPVGLMAHYISNSTKQGQTVLDPFMGVGSTGVASVRQRRKFVGIEIDRTWFDIACRRVAAALKQPDMFVEPKATAKQEAFEL